MAWTSNYYQPWPTTKYDQSDKPQRVEGYKPGSETLSKQSPYQHLSGTSVYAVATPCTPESYINTHKSKSKKNKKRRPKNSTDSLSKHNGVYANGISNGCVHDDASDKSEAERKRQKKERKAKIMMVVIILLVLIGVIICVIAVYYTVNSSRSAEEPDSSPSASGLHSPPRLAHYNVSFVMDAIRYHTDLHNQGSQKYKDLSETVCSVLYFIFSQYSQVQDAYQNCAILKFRKTSSFVHGSVAVDAEVTFLRQRVEEQLLKNSNKLVTDILKNDIVEKFSKSDREIVVNFVDKYDPNIHSIHVTRIKHPNE